MTDTRSPAQLIEACAAELGLTMTTEFVPWSKSRAKDEKQPSLNWKVTIRRNGRDVLTTDYGAGMGHCPAYKASVKQLGDQNSIMRREYIDRECETGHRAIPVIGTVAQSLGQPILPALADVLASLVMDSEVLDDGGFESWADNYGYDTDSRKAEATYRACLEIALKLRSALGDDGLTKLRAAAQDY